MTDAYDIRPRSSLKYAGIGFLVGLLVPAFALLLDGWARATPLTGGGILALHRTNPLHWITDLAPILVAAFFGVVFPRLRHLAVLVEKYRELARRTSVELERESLVRKEAQEDASRDALFLREILNQSPLAMVALDAAGAVLDTNPAFDRLFGYPQEEALGRPLHDLIVPEDLRAEAENLSLRTSDGHQVQADIVRTRKDGHRLHLAVHGVRIELPNNRTGLYAIYEDISARKEAERELRFAKEAAESLNQAKSRFLANMSHEIRTPMNGIVGMTDLALDTDLTEEQREYLETVRSSADALLAIINDILDFSKIEAGRIELFPVDFSLRDVLSESLRPLAIGAEKKKLELLCHVAPDVPDSLHGDPGRLRQVIVNLAGNAVKFTDRGEVEVRVDNESSVGRGIPLHFSVRDTGIGISPEMQQLVFGAFVQSDASMTRRHGGTGLGLSISRELVSLMNGRIWVESEPGKGSTFHFTAVFDEAKEPILPVPMHTLPTLADRRVLVVDDNATNRRILVEMFAHWDTRATAVDGGPAALETMRRAVEERNPYDLVILDAHMPDMDGFQLAGEIQADEDLRKATLMMLTSAGGQGDAARCAELGIVAYLKKPITSTDLWEGIRRATGTAPRKKRDRKLVTPENIWEGQRRARVLLAEDNRVNRMLAERLLTKHGHSVTAVEDGHLAVKAFREGSFDAVLMDVQMPEMDGFEATSRIREIEAETGGHVPIVALTAHAMEGDRERCLSAGMDAYLSKPIDARKLFEIMHDLITATCPAPDPA